MAVRRILQLGDPVLREKSRPVKGPGACENTLCDLRDTLHDFQRTHGFGRGISAIQIGVSERVIYMEFEGSPWCLVNPIWEYLSPEKFQLWDDCFSFPNLLVRVERSKSIRVRFFDVSGGERVLEASGAFSELIQHEMDHLEGVLAIDRALDGNSLCTREEWLRSYRIEPGSGVVASV
jgi:peptide deformylase